MDLSIVILNYKAKDYLRKALQAVFNSKSSISFEVFVVDNDSQDGSAEMVEQEFGGKLTLLREPNNGFSAGNNAGIKLAKGEYILLLNPDTEVAADTFQVMLDFFKSHPNCGIATCKLVVDSGQIDPACRRSFPDPVNSFFYLFGLSKLLPNNKLTHAYQRAFTDEDQIQQVDAVNGAFEMISRRCLEKIGLLDERYFMWAEDIDWCFQAKKAGFQVWYVPTTTTLHHKGQPHRKSRRMLKIFYDSMFLYYRKNLSSQYPWLLNQVVYIGISLRYGIAVILNQFKPKE